MERACKPIAAKPAETAPLAPQFWWRTPGPDGRDLGPFPTNASACDAGAAHAAWMAAQSGKSALAAGGPDLIDRRLVADALWLDTAGDAP